MHRMPFVEIIGVHPLPVTRELRERTFRTKYGEPVRFCAKPDRVLEQAWKHVREELESIVLVEARITGCAGTADLGGWGQSGSGVRILSPDDQAAYAEMFLSDDGSSVVSDYLLPENTEAVRVVFWLHFYDPARPIVTSFGPVYPPDPSPMPERLSRLVTYEPVD
jgi:hypothetical protein